MGMQVLAMRMVKMMKKMATGLDASLRHAVAHAMTLEGATPKDVAAWANTIIPKKHAKKKKTTKKNRKATKILRKHAKKKKTAKKNRKTTKIPRKHAKKKKATKTNRKATKKVHTKK